MILKQNTSPWTGVSYCQQSRGRWCPWVWISPPPRTLQGVTTLLISQSAVSNNGKVGNQVLCPHSRCFGSYLDVIFLMYLVFWLFFQANLILLNHPHWPSLAKSEWWMCRTVVVKHSINQNPNVNKPAMKGHLSFSDNYLGFSGVLWGQVSLYIIETSQLWELEHLEC